jgi:hypothetical protein
LAASFQQTQQKVDQTIETLPRFSTLCMGSMDYVWLNVASKQGMKPAIICSFKSLIC